MRIENPLALFDIKDVKVFDRIDFVLDKTSQERQLLDRGLTISQISKLTDIHPVELALYFTSIAYMDEVTMSIILERTGNTDILPRTITWSTGEHVVTMAAIPTL
jgi:hypothetical protein